MELRDHLQRSLGATYTLDRELTGGGMSRVFVAHDTRLDRDIVVKLLPPDLSGAISAERFQREIAVAARLQHPHIVPLLAAGDVDGVPYYTMPFIDGESLRQRLVREGELGVADAVGILKEVARALAYAHERGVVHRDIKPDNVLLSGGSAMVTDFGVAKALSASTSGGAAPLTQLGVALGTPAYMAPEQASAEPTVDHRADLYALGCMAYEMLTGRTPFAGRPGPALLAAQVTEQPEPLLKLRPNTPAPLAALVMQCLEKRASDRPRNAGEVLRVLDGVVVTPAAMASVALPSVPADTSSSRGRGLRPLRWEAAGVIAVLGVALAVVSLRGRAARDDDPVIRMSLPFNDSLRFSAQTRALAITPDGATIAFIGIGSAGRMVFSRHLEHAHATAVTGNGGYTQIFAAPDGKRMLAIFGQDVFSGGLDGGSPRRVATLPPGNIFGASWGDNDTVVVALQGRGLATLTASAAGEWPLSAPRVRPDTAGGERSLRWPLLLRDGHTVVYGRFDATARPERAQLAAASLATGRSWALGISGSCPLAIIDGYLVYANGVDGLSAIAFDESHARVTGRAVPVLDSIPIPLAGCPQAALSRRGDLLYVARQSSAEVDEVDATGARRRVIGEPRIYSRVRYSPDGKRIAVQLATTAGHGLGIWIYDIASQTLSPLAVDEGFYDILPEWTPDGQRVLWVSNKRPDTLDTPGGAGLVMWRRADGSAPAEPLVGVDEMGGPNALHIVTPDGSRLLYNQRGRVAVHHLDGRSGPDEVLDIPSSGARLSADGRWIAYSARLWSVSVQPFPGPGPRVQVAAGAEHAAEPVWSRDGTRIYYMADGTVKMASVRTAPVFEVLGRQALFDARPYVSGPGAATYDVSPDGKHLLMVHGLDDGEVALIHNWRALMHARIDAAR